METRISDLRSVPLAKLDNHPAKVQSIIDRVVKDNSTKIPVAAFNASL